MAHPKVLELAKVLESCITETSTHRLKGKSVHAHILRRGFIQDIFLSNRLIELYSKCKSPLLATRVFQCMRQKNVFSWNAILSVHLKTENLNVARQLFEEMPVRNVVSWNMAITSALRGGNEEEALGLCRMMMENGFVPTRFTLAGVLSACGSLVDLGCGRRWHGVAVKVGLAANSFVENALVGMYAKCGSMSEAVEVFDLVSEPNEVTFTAMIGGLVQHGSVEEALKLFARMHHIGIRLDDIVFSTVLGACSRTADGESANSHGMISFAETVHALLIEYGFEYDVHVSNSLLDLYVKWGLMDKAESVFLTMPRVNVVSWNVIVGGYGQIGDTGKAMDLLQQMEDARVEPDDVTYMAQVNMYAKIGDLKTASRIFDKIPNPSQSLWNCLLSGYCQQEDYESAVELFRKMQSTSIQPDRSTLAIVLSSCAGIGSLKLGKQVHAASTRLMLHVDMFVASGLVDMYSKCGCIEAARRVFEMTPGRDVVSWNSMITGFALHSMGKEAFTLFKEMRESGMVPTEYTYASVISSCSGLASLAQGRGIHALTEKEGLTSSVFVGSSMIDMYAKCGGVEEARWFFDSMPVKNIVSWNEMIHGYAQNGFGKEAVELFRNMLDTEQKPDAVTFIAALTACSHSGLVDEGLGIFNSMEQHAIKPHSHHYTCIIDALGRAGRFEEVKALISRMPHKNDPIIWEVLLSACRVHANTELGKLAADQLFQLDPENSAPYTLLANIYAASGRWTDALAVRRLMSDRGVVKNRGYSWTGQNDGIHAFMVDDDMRVLNEHFKNGLCILEG